MVSKLRRLVFLSLVLVFGWILLIIFSPALSSFNQGLLPFILFSILGLGLLFLLPKSTLNNKHYRYLALTGGAAVGLMAGVLLHNLFYVVGIKFSDIRWLVSMSEFLHTVFFLISVVVSPVGFAIGVIGSFLTHKKFS